MFSGFGISADGINFAMALRAGLYFRSDDQTIRNSKPRDRSRFSTDPGQDRHVSTHIANCRRGFFDEPEELTVLGQSGTGGGPNARP